MKLYLSSYRVGSKENQKKLIDICRSTNMHVAFIDNTLDWNYEGQENTRSRDIGDLESLGLVVTHVDLRQYFCKKDVLADTLDAFDIIWVRGGNVFVLREAMKRSGLDQLLVNWYQEGKEKIYGGFSAGGCVLGPTLLGYTIVDDDRVKPYSGEYETKYDGLNIVPYALAPHYKSHHPESEQIDKEIDKMIDMKIPFVVLKHGEVIIIE